MQYAHRARHAAGSNASRSSQSLFVDHPCDIFRVGPLSLFSCHEYCSKVWRCLRFTTNHFLTPVFICARKAERVSTRRRMARGHTFRFSIQTTNLCSRLASL